MGLKKRARFLQPAILKFAIAVNELHKPRTGPPVEQALQSLIARTGCSEWTRQVKLDHIGAHGASKADAMVRRCAVDINHALARRHGPEATVKPFTLVAPDYNNSKVALFTQVRTLPLLPRTTTPE
jgi:hypothetical protein